MAAVAAPRRHPWEASPSDPKEATISARAMAKARGTVQDFVLSCFPLLGLEIADCLAFLDVLYFLEASLYEADERNEEGEGAGCDEEEAGCDVTLGALRRFLRSRGLFDRDVEKELETGRGYWRAERDLTAAWRLPRGADQEETLLLERAKGALLAKSFDYRMLCLVTARLIDEHDNCSSVMAMLSRSFTLVEIEDDLKDYTTDVQKDTFNIYRAFVRCYGTEAPDKVLDYITELEAAYLEKRNLLDHKALLPHMSRNEQQKGAGPVMAPSSGRWQIPKPVIDEKTIRLLGDYSLPTFIVRSRPA